MPQIMGTFHNYYFSTITTAIMVLNVFIIKNTCSFGYKMENREELKEEGEKKRERGGEGPDGKKNSRGGT
jgi:hypothetical protein